MIATKPNIEIAQDPWELQQLLSIIPAGPDKGILEIGVWHGGTLWQWIHRTPYVTAVDDAMAEADEWRAWADASDTDLELVQGSSGDPDVVERVRGRAPFDFIFIDADHTYDGVAADWANYGSMLVPGGAAAFHDINPRNSYGVDRFWYELKQNHRTVEINAGVPGYCGIGVIWPT